jgi:hypothetical protein
VKKAQTGLFVLHQAIAKVREHYKEDVQKIAQQLLHERATNRISNAESADEQLYEYVTASDWLNDNHEGIVLYLSSNRDVADTVITRIEIDRDNIVRQRAACAMTADVCKLLWADGWHSVGREYRVYSVTPEVHDAVSEVLRHGRVVCDQLEANREPSADTVEAKLLHALDELERIMTK